MKYTQVSSTTVQRDDGVFVPVGADTDDSRAYRAWVGSGNSVAAQVAANPRIAEIKLALIAIDAKKVRALTDAQLTDNKARLQALEAQAAALRSELATL